MAGSLGTDSSRRRVRLPPREAALFLGAPGTGCEAQLVWNLPKGASGPIELLLKDLDLTEVMSIDPRDGDVDRAHETPPVRLARSSAQLRSPLTE